MKRKKINIRVMHIIPSVIISVVFVLIVRYIWNSLQTSGYFLVKDVFVKGIEATDELLYLKGRSIFDVDLKAESRRLLDSCSDCSNVRLARVLPGRVFVYFLKRQAVAQVKLYRNFAVDENGFFFQPGEQAESTKLPVIAGLETKIFKPRTGERYDIPELILALEIIKAVASDSILNKYVIKNIDVSKTSEIALELLIDPENEPPNGYAAVTVKLTQDNLSKNIELLGRVFANSEKDLKGIKYIDLRFSDPIIRLNDAK